jgi:TRAP-type transport system small permease protein
MKPLRIGRFINIIHSIIRYVCYLGMATLLLLMLLTVADVIGRSTFNKPVSGTYEISKFLLPVIVLFSIGYVEQCNQNIRVDFFTNKMPVRGRLLIDIFFTALAICFFCLIVWQGLNEGILTYASHMASDILKIPTYPFQFAIPFGAFLLVIELILRIVVSIRALNEKSHAKEATI